MACSRAVAGLAKAPQAVSLLPLYWSRYAVPLSYHLLADSNAVATR